MENTTKQQSIKEGPSPQEVRICSDTTAVGKKQDKKTAYLPKGYKVIKEAGIPR